MYGFWWNKPLLPSEPFLITGDWVEPLCAYMYMCSEISGLDIKDRIEGQTSVKKFFVWLNFYTKAPEIEGLCAKQILHRESADGDVAPQKNSEIQIENLSCESAHPECLDQITDQANEKRGDTAFFERRPRLKNHISANPSDITRKRWSLTMEAIERYPELQKRGKRNMNKPFLCLHPKPEQYLVKTVSNWPSEDLLRQHSGLEVGIILWLSNFLYGGLHALAWHEFFPTIIEKWLWRSTALYISFCGGLWVILNTIVLISNKLNSFWDGWMDGKASWISDIVLGSLVSLCGSAFILARAFIVVEAFVSIRELPITAYDTLSWSQIWPHL